MTTLSSLLSDIGPTSIGNVPTWFKVWHTSYTSVSNGGCCCLWTVPAGIVSIQFEMYGGGGGGSRGGYGGGNSGSYGGGYSQPNSTYANKSSGAEGWEDRSYGNSSENSDFENSRSRRKRSVVSNSDISQESN